MTSDFFSDLFYYLGVEISRYFFSNEEERPIIIIVRSNMSFTASFFQALGAGTAQGIFNAFQQHAAPKKADSAEARTKDVAKDILEKPPNREIEPLDFPVQQPVARERRSRHDETKRAEAAQDPASKKAADVKVSLEDRAKGMLGKAPDREIEPLDFPVQQPLARERGSRHDEARRSGVAQDHAPKKLVGVKGSVEEMAKDILGKKPVRAKHPLGQERDSRYDQAERARQEGDKCADAARENWRDAVDAVFDKHPGEFDRQVNEGVKNAKEARDHYGEANDLEWDAAKDQVERARDQRGGNCCIM